MTKKISFGIAIGVLGLAAPKTQALSMLTLSEAGFPTLTIIDNGPGDFSPVVGSIVFAGPYGNYMFESDTGNTKPAVGGPSSPLLALANTTVTLSTPTAFNPLTVTFTEFGFDPGTYNFTSDINGTAAAQTVSFSTWANGTPLSSYTGGPGSFNSTPLSQLYSSAAPITLTLQAVITHPINGGLTLFDANLIGEKRQTPVPDAGATAALLGLGFLGMASLRSRP